MIYCFSEFSDVLLLCLFCVVGFFLSYFVEANFLSSSKPSESPSMYNDIRLLINQLFVMSATMGVVLMFCGIAANCLNAVGLFIMCFGLSGIISEVTFSKASR